jgi:beta-lactamase superfamily II metal-dependent hydrolase
MQNKTLFLDVNTLRLEVFVIGYPDKGESQIIIISDISHNILFSCVIDCYEHAAINKTVEILESKGVQDLTLFIWTHTDEDHSFGIDNLIKKFCKKTTRFLLPELITGNEKDFVEYNEYVKACFDSINAFNVGGNYCVSSATVIPGGHSQVFFTKFIDKKTGSQLNFEILAIAPLSALIRRRWDSGIVKKKNDLSIATIFKVGNLNLLFSSDIENQTISQIADYHFQNLAFLKTPHHTSKTSTKLIDKILANYTAKIPTAVTTIYKVHNLPDGELVDEYKKITEKFYSTGIGDQSSGVTHTTFDIVNNIIIDEMIFGNAVLL